MQGSPRTPRVTRTCASVPVSRYPLSLPSPGAAPGAWGQRRGCPGWGGVRLTGSWRCQNWPAELPAGLLDTVTQAGRSHVVPVAGVCPGATSCPRWLWTPGRAPYLGRVPPSGGGGAGPALWPQGSSAPPANPTPGPGLASRSAHLHGVPVTPATLPWLAAGRLSAPVAGQPFAGQGGVGRRVGQPWLLCLGQAGAFSASGWAACPGLQAVLHSLVARPRLQGPLADKTHLSEKGL